jgi:hypothetical protein
LPLATESVELRRHQNTRKFIRNFSVIAGDYEWVDVQQFQCCVRGEDARLPCLTIATQNFATFCRKFDTAKLLFLRSLVVFRSIDDLQLNQSSDDDETDEEEDTMEHENTSLKRASFLRFQY